MGNDTAVLTKDGTTVRSHRKFAKTNVEYFARVSSCGFIGLQTRARVRVKYQTVAEQHVYETLSINFSVIQSTFVCKSAISLRPTTGGVYIYIWNIVREQLNRKQKVIQLQIW